MKNLITATVLLPLFLSFGSAFSMKQVSTSYSYNFSNLNNPDHKNDKFDHKVDNLQDDNNPLYFGPNLSSVLKKHHHINKNRSSLKK